jgi:hypothetical protein
MTRRTAVPPLALFTATSAPRGPTRSLSASPSTRALRRCPSRPRTPLRWRWPLTPRTLHPRRRRPPKSAGDAERVPVHSTAASQTASQSPSLYLLSCSLSVRLCTDTHTGDGSARRDAVLADHVRVELAHGHEYRRVPHHPACHQCARQPVPRLRALAHTHAEATTSAEGGDRDARRRGRGTHRHRRQHRRACRRLEPGVATGCTRRTRTAYQRPRPARLPCHRRTHPRRRHSKATSPHASWSLARTFCLIHTQDEGERGGGRGPPAPRAYSTRGMAPRARPAHLVLRDRKRPARR